MFTLRTNEDVYYGFDAERLADTTLKKIAGTKVYCYDTGKLWVADGVTVTAGTAGWHEIGVAG